MIGVNSLENYNELMDALKEQLKKGQIQKAYRYIFDTFSKLSNELKSTSQKNISVNTIYHGYLDMTYLPVLTDMLKENGLKVAVVFNYEVFQFEIWLSAINRKKRQDILVKMDRLQWHAELRTQNDENLDAIIVMPVTQISDFNIQNTIVQLLFQNTIFFIDEIEHFLKQ